MNCMLKRKQLVFYEEKACVCTVYTCIYVYITWKVDGTTNMYWVYHGPLLSHFWEGAPSTITTVFFVFLKTATSFRLSKRHRSSIYSRRFQSSVTWDWRTGQVATLTIWEAKLPATNTLWEFKCRGRRKRQCVFFSCGNCLGYFTDAKHKAFCWFLREVSGRLFLVHTLGQFQFEFLM